MVCNTQSSSIAQKAYCNAFYCKIYFTNKEKAQSEIAHFKTISSRVSNGSAKRIIVPENASRTQAFGYDSV
jgi:hypothetical protein